MLEIWILAKRTTDPGLGIIQIKILLITQRPVSTCTSLLSNIVMLTFLIVLSLVSVILLRSSFSIR